MPPSQVITFIIGTIVILFGAYYVTYYIGTKASGRTRAGLRNRNIVVRDMYSISRDKSFCVVEIAGKVYIVGVGPNTMTLFDTIDAQEFEEYILQNDTGAGAQMPWTDTPVGRYGNRLTKKVALFIATKLGRAPEDPETAPGETDFTETMRKAEEKAAKKTKKNTPEGDD